MNENEKKEQFTFGSTTNTCHYFILTTEKS